MNYVCTSRRKAASVLTSRKNKNQLFMVKLKAYQLYFREVCGVNVMYPDFPTENYSHQILFPLKLTGLNKFRPRIRLPSPGLAKLCTQASDLSIFHE